MTVAAPFPTNAPAQPVFELIEVEQIFHVRPPGRRFTRERLDLRALDGVRLRVMQGASVALVGESGSGKSTLLRVLLGLDAPSGGQALYRGRPIRNARARGAVFARDVAMVYQDARGSLNPRMTVEALIAEPLRHFDIVPAWEIPDRVALLLDRVGLPSDAGKRYPAGLSGGQVRRVAIARALASEPSVLVADEAVSGLDVSTQAQLLTLLRGLQREMGLTLVFITHDLGVASYLCEEIAIMYLGRIVERGPTDAVLAAPAHPYAAALRAAAPRFFEPMPDPLPGEIPSPLDLPKGCRFSSRCPNVQPDCHDRDPHLGSFGADRAVACLHPLTLPGLASKP
ncbi:MULTISPECIES: oligopeptide/dipeptide ABC transporter ATP-binding protein [Roseobacteraceae]|uniref:Oligopeptide transport ATP-binding protein OppF n=1 Tax=Pseudosulfitobacter pseudonitzschiae TaxID=1402135 RepID=A0A221K7V0_9RHOB|nr:MULTISPECIES: ABC transporter ATP-binding protein [Roseobacteraceae]ASM75074.1 oligopeptide transport ATP-binding protein OppF [Pseudosulfitobacter pseudonitzschiae]